MIRKVYHGSNQPELKILEPAISSHKKPYVYGSENPAVAMLFLARWNDYIFRVGYDESQLFIVENYQGALKDIFSSAAGYLYELEPRTFTYRKELWKAEVVSESPVRIIGKKRIDNIYDNLVALDRTGELKVYPYPLRPDFYPSDDQDLIDRLIQNIERFGMNHLDEFYKIHYHLKDRVELALKDMKYVL